MWGLSGRKDDSGKEVVSSTSSMYHVAKTVVSTSFSVHGGIDASLAQGAWWKLCTRTCLLTSRIFSSFKVIFLTHCQSSFSTYRYQLTQGFEFENPSATKYSSMAFPPLPFKKPTSIHGISQISRTISTIWTSDGSTTFGFVKTSSSSVRVLARW